MSENVKSRIDILKSRLFPFVEEGNSLSLKIPCRLLIGFKIFTVNAAIKDLLQEKHKKILIFESYQEGEKEYVFNYKEV